MAGLVFGRLDHVYWSECTAWTQLPNIQPEPAFGEWVPFTVDLIYPHQMGVVLVGLLYFHLHDVPFRAQASISLMCD